MIFIMASSSFSSRFYRLICLALKVGAFTLYKTSSETKAPNFAEGKPPKIPKSVKRTLIALVYKLIKVVNVDVPKDGIFKIKKNC